MIKLRNNINNRSNQKSQLGASTFLQHQTQLTRQKYHGQINWNEKIVKKIRNTSGIASVKKARPKLQSIETNHFARESFIHCGILPELAKSTSVITDTSMPFGEMKTIKLDHSKQILKQRTKNTKILNHIIQILKTDPSQIQEEEENKISKKPAAKRQRKMLTESACNEFLSPVKIVKEELMYQREPKIPSNYDFMKLCRTNKSKNSFDKISITRNIYSEERSRGTKFIEHKKMSINPETQPSELLTFYNPSINIAKTNKQINGTINVLEAEL